MHMAAFCNEILRENLCVCERERQRDIERDRERGRKEGLKLKRWVKHAVIYTWQIPVSKPTFMHQRAKAIDGCGD